MYLQGTSTEASKCLNISVEVFVPKDNIELINDWLSGHSLNTLKADELPDTGFMLLEEGFPVGCVFMYHDKATGWIEGCLSNPFVDSGKVAENFHFSLDYIEGHAKSMGIKYLTVSTVITSHARNFIDSGYDMINRCISLRKELI